MANDNDTNDSSSPTENPFISFRRLVDNHIASAIHSLNEQAGITTSPTSQRACSQKQQQPTQTPDESFSSLFNIFAQPPLHGLAMSSARDPHERATAPVPSLIPSQLWTCLVPRQGTWDSNFTLNGDGRGLEALQYGITERGTFAWWRHYSPYAPTNLIHDSDLPERLKLQWHPAFYDLMSRHNGEEKEPALARLCSLMWHAETAEDMQADVHSLEDKRGMDWNEDTAVWDARTGFAPVPLVRKAVGAGSAENEEEVAPATEEDMYNGFLKHQQQQHASVSAQSRSEDTAKTETCSRTAYASSLLDEIVSSLFSVQDKESDQSWSPEAVRRRFGFVDLPRPLDWLSGASTGAEGQDAQEEQEQANANRVVKLVQHASQAGDLDKAAETSRIISMVTTSHTSTLPDGTSRTVRRWKKTFADGREESNEDVQDTPARIHEAKPAIEESKKEMKKGWFWN